MLFQAMDQTSTRALETHRLHSKRYGYTIFLTSALHFGQHLEQARPHACCMRLELPRRLAQESEIDL